MKTFECYCGNTLHFENTRCLACGRALGFLPEHLVLSALDPAENGRWHALHPKAHGAHYHMCENYKTENVCNWMVPVSESSTFCRGCRLNRTIPNLTEQKNRVLWSRVEQSKRRLLYSLYCLSLPVIGRDTDAEHGLSFSFLADAEAGGEFADDLDHRRHVLTGHRTGLITINIAEADPKALEEMREKMYEEYRALLGHFRHEIGHYYWDRLVAGSVWLESFRAMFGDERTDYSAALNRYYAEGAPADWRQNYISAYASAHPWEDWAETWAHYLHMVDTLDTAYDYGFAIEGREVRPPSVSVEVGESQLTSTDQAYTVSFDDILLDWSRLTNVMNALNRSMGQRDAYPFALSPTAAGKVRFVHGVIRSAAKAN